MKIKEIKCQRALSPCGIVGFDYSLNPYVGCYYGCVYCYARFMCRYRKGEEKWGEFVDVKINISRALEKQVEHLKPGLVMVSSVTDPYQPLEAKYKITRRCLEILERNKFQIALLTKSPLITRDIDIIRKFNTSKRWTQPGLTIICLNERDARNFELRAPSIKSRLSALAKMSEAGIPTLVFLGPFIPGISDKNIEKLFKRFKEVGVKTILLDKLNLKSGNWVEIKKVLDEHYPDLAVNYRRKWLTKEYYQGIKKRVVNLCNKYKFSLDLVFRP